METTTTLALPAPARFKLNRSIKVPDIRYWSRELDRLRTWGYFRDERDRKARIADAEFQLDYATFVAEYVATHNCNPKVVSKRTDFDWRGHRSAVVQVEGSIYRVSVSMGRRALGMYGKRGHHWHLYVARDGTDRRLCEGNRCEKSAGLGSAAVRYHLAGKYAELRGLKESQK
jgi:hypothetical protein